MMIRICLSVCCVVLLLPMISARADWDPGDGAKMHYPQLPDLTPAGMDIFDTQVIGQAPNGLSLADDWTCTQTGPVSDIHFWGSWAGDQEGIISSFRLAIYSDVPDPDGTGPEYSHPGEPLWIRDFDVGQWTQRIYAQNLQEGWYDPMQNQLIVPGDSIAWQYNFTNIVDPFIQEKGTVYWLEVRSFVVQQTQGGGDSTPVQPLWGWKTADPQLQPHHLDDAVWMNPDFIWEELRYPIGHPYETQSIDLSFVITPEPASLCMLVIGGLILTGRKWRN